MFKDLRIRTKLLIAFLAVGVIPFAIIAITSLNRSSAVISKQVFDQLKTVQEIKKAQVEELFKRCRSDMMVLSKNPALPEAIPWLLMSFNEDRSMKKEAYEFTVAKYGAFLGQFISEYGYYDLLLITKDGDIVYSSKQESDLGQNVLTGPLKGSHLNTCFQGGLKGMAIHDFNPYSPSGNKYIAFLAVPFYKEDSLSAESSEGEKELIGVIALKLNNDPINKIVHRREGMGKTGETYMVGKNDGKNTLRTDLTTQEEDNLRIGQEIPGTFLGKAFSGQSGAEIYAHKKGSQLVSYNPLNIEGLNWVITSKIDEAEAFKALNTLKWIVTIIAVLCIAVIVGIGLLFTRSIIKPIKGVLNRIRDIAEGEGDLTARLEIANKDEMGELAQWFNRFIDNLQTMIKNIAENAEILNRSSTGLSDLSEKMSDGASEMSSKANAVASASEEMSSNMDTVAAAMEEASTNMGMVATSAEEMTATISEIARNSEKARTITSEAVARASGASVKVDELGHAAQEIGKVTETITEISEQTNLLALNATIEAARAGEAGKGFAVVANEIKELARQTAEATQEIKKQIDDIQNSTSGTVSEIEGILKVIDNVNEIVSTIATAVEEQSLTTKEIAGNVAQASKGIQEVNENVAQSSTVSTEIAKDITEVNQAAEEMSNSSAQINLSTSELSKLAGQLKEMVKKFKV